MLGSSPALLTLLGRLWSADDIASLAPKLGTPSGLAPAGSPQAMGRHYLTRALLYACSIHAHILPTLDAVVCALGSGLHRGGEGITAPTLVPLFSSICSRILAK